jgi:LmbE family N-acetylglucosaminyl deacetylase
LIGLTLPDAELDVLCLGAHPDDIEIGCGGMLLALIASGHASVRSAVLTGSADRHNEARHAAREFSGSDERLSLRSFPDGRLPGHWGEVKQFLEDLAKATAPHVVLTPRADDSHQDHRLIASLAKTTWRDSLILQYEIPKWDGDLRPVTHYFPLTEEQAHRKLELLHTCFASQRHRDWWDDEVFYGLMRLRGMEARCRYAEGFLADKVRLDIAVVH